MSLRKNAYNAKMNVNKTNDQGRNQLKLELSMIEMSIPFSKFSL